MEQGAPGKDWALGNGHTIKFNYAVNTTSDAVKKFNVNFLNSTEETELIYDGIYNPSVLYKTITKDENWMVGQQYQKDHTTEEFKDRLGRVVLKRTYNATVLHDTYYVYDIYGNLTYVIPPEASWQIGQGPLGFRISSQTNYSWADLVLVDNEFAEEYNKKLLDYENEAILNADIQNKYGGQGGFTVNTHENQELVTLSITFSADTPFALKQGELVSLTEFGSFKDTELGKIIGNDFEYIFLIKNNAIILEKLGKGDGKLTSINEIFNSDIKLAYTKNYPWTSYADVDPKFANEYEKQLDSIPNSDILGVNIPNDYGGQGGLNITIDENDNVFLIFNSSTTTPIRLKEGLVIPLNAKRKIADRDNFETFLGYTLSIKNNSLFISGKQSLTSFIRTFGIPVPTIPIDHIKGLCYIYHYDGRNRLIEKKIPGKGWEYIVYDKLDRPILTQDAKMRLIGSWLFTKYDAFGRLVYTGLYQTNSSILGNENADRIHLQAQINNQTTHHETKLNNSNNIIDGINIKYTNNTFPIDNLTLHTINYYDDYSFNYPSELVFSNSYNQPQADNVKSLVTASKIRILDTDDWITTLTYYDEKARPIYSASKNEYLNTVDWSKTQLDFVGKVLESTTYHERTGLATIETINSFSYDHMGRLLTQTQSINNGLPELIVNNHYDELGQLTSKNVGGIVSNIPEDSNGLQTVDYNYNIRGWLQQINNPDNLGNDLFGFQIYYNKPTHSTSIELYNGNISQTNWKTNSQNQSKFWYMYRYDALNRIKKAQFAGGGWYDRYSLKNINYDRNGNIIYLKRNGHIVNNPNSNSSSDFDVMDQLTYTYAPKSNLLMSVTDVASYNGFEDQNTVDNDYGYDVNGNLIFDKNKDILNIKYNHLNLPIKVETINGFIEYAYDAIGVKQDKKVIVPNGIVYRETVTSYAGNFIYNKNIIGANITEGLEFFNQPEGYVKPINNENFDYIYQYKDHLGNIRLSYKNTGTDTTPVLEIQEENNYYPFGLEHKGYNNVVNGVQNNFKTYQGQEFHDELGLNMHEFKYRFYDAAIGRFWSVDPLANDYVYNSPYAFSENKLGMGIELEGLEIMPFDIIWAVLRSGVQSKMNSAGDSANKALTAINPANTVARAVNNPNFDPEKDRIARTQEFVKHAGDVAGHVSDAGHLTLDIIGTAEPTGLVDGVHSLWYAAEGDYVSAGLTAAGILPYIGDTFKAGKYLKYGDDVADLVKATGKIDGSAKEIVTVLKEGTVGNGIKVANDAIGGLGDDAVEKLGKFGSQDGVRVGSQSANGKKGWRVDYDSKKGGHINWWNGNEKGAIILNAGQNQIDQIIKNGTF